MMGRKIRLSAVAAAGLFTSGLAAADDYHCMRAGAENVAFAFNVLEWSESTREVDMLGINGTHYQGVVKSIDSIPEGKNVTLHFSDLDGYLGGEEIDFRLVIHPTEFSTAIGAGFIVQDGERRLEFVMSPAMTLCVAP